MADQAVVVGCDAYPDLPRGDLRGAVADALAVRDWLLSRQGGGIEEDRLTFLASCSPSGVQAAPEIVAAPASRRNFVRVVERLASTLEAGESDRLFIYLAGHGCRTDPENPVLAHDAFAFTDFNTDDVSAACISVQDLVSKLRQSRFGTFVIIIDACRNFPFRRPLQPARIGFDPDVPRGRPYEPRLFLLQSTLPGRVSKGMPGKSTASPVRGDFTIALLDGLSGVGSAKSYDETADRPYRVWWSSLTRFLEVRVPEQCPRGAGEGDFVLATFPDGFFDSVKLTVQVDPRDLRQTDDLRISVRYIDPSAPDDPVINSPGPSPVEFLVPPRRHHVMARSGDIWGRRTLDAYADATVVVPMRPGGPRRVTLPPDAVIFRGGNIRPEGAAEIRSDDPSAVLQIHDRFGDIAISGIGSVTRRLAPGTYTAVLIDHEGRRHLEPLDVDPLAVTRVTMAGSTPVATFIDFGRQARQVPDALRWASDAAVLAWGIGGADPLGFPHPFPIAVAGTGPRPRISVRLRTSEGPAPVQQIVEIGQGDWWGCYVPGELPVRDEASWFTLNLMGHTLTVPGVPGAGTCLTIRRNRFVVALFDQDALVSPRKLALLDRSQVLLGAGEREAALAVVAASDEEPGQAGQVAALLRQAAGGQAAGHGLAAAIGPADASDLLPAGPWAALADRTARRPLPVGALPGGRPQRI